MKTIWKIYTTDVKKICTNFFALVVAIAVLFLAALYAWANIYSNWDPYGNTGGMALAAISLDKGFTDDAGDYINVGEDVMADLAESDAIDWHFVDSEAEAIEGVEDGTYYGAVVISEDFSYHMYNMLTEEVEKPQLTFYQNQKKNPVATKISDTVVGKVQSSIDKAFVKAMTKIVFEGANDLYDDMEENGGVDGFIDKLKNVHEQIQDYVKMMDTIIAGDKVLTAAINEADSDSAAMSNKANEGAADLDKAKGELDKTELTLYFYEQEMNQSLNSVQSSLAEVKGILETAQLTQDAIAMSSAASKSAELINGDDGVIEQLTVLRAALIAGGVLETDKQIKEINGLIAQAELTYTTLSTLSQSSQISGQVASYERSAAGQLDIALRAVKDSQNQLNNDLIPQINSSLANLEDIMDGATDLMHSLSNTLLGMGNVFDALQVTVNSADDSLVKTREALIMIDDRLVEVIDKVESATDDDKVKILTDTLSGDPELYGEFFSEPVQMETTEVYAVENYGSAVAPFYTTLALWVGGTILVSILKVHPKKEDYPEAHMWQFFFGRYLLFFTMAQLQNLLIVLGDLFLLKIQCMHPFLFWLAGFVGATTFSLFIFALTVAFGDVGKAAAVVVLVLQIAGSSGTYPIELLPEFFQKVYIFFPFPYVINAMRESIAGLYQLDYVVYLLQECIFIVVALVIGLVIRKPVSGLARYMEERMEDTEMM